MLHQIFLLSYGRVAAGGRPSSAERKQRGAGCSKNGAPLSKKGGREKTKERAVGGLKVAVYSGTRNVYRDMAASCKSLFAHTQVDRVYFLIEDDVFPEVLPKNIRCVNISKQRYFPKGGPNHGSRWTYMVLLRAAYPHIFESNSVILSLDTDTIVCSDISRIWDTRFGGAYLAGVPEPIKSTDDDPYLNMGVMLMNLRGMREDGIWEQAVRELNTKKYPFCEQDVLNELCKGKKIALPSCWNVSNWTCNSGETKIRHYAAETGWRDKPLVKKYRDMVWMEAERLGRRG